MKLRSITAATVVLAVAVGLGCVEDSADEEPNSDQGYLFVDLEDPLAVDWESEVLVRGPAAGGEHCDDRRGCYPDHETLDMKEVVSTDPEVVKVRDFEPDSYGEADAVRLDLEVVGEGTADLKFEFLVEGWDAPTDQDSEDGDEADDETDEKTEEQTDQAADGEPEVLTDSFEVEARDVVSTRLGRLTDDIDPAGPFGRCPETANGAYLMRDTDEYAVELKFAKLDNRGNLLRGSGKFPVDVEPEDAIEVTDVDEPRHRIVVEPTRFGHVSMKPEGAGTALEAEFRRWGDVTDMDVSLYQLGEQAARLGEVETMTVEHLYEVEAMPDLGEDPPPLCGGDIMTVVETMTPALCEFGGVVEETGNPAFVATNGGECRLEVTLQDGEGTAHLVEDHRFEVQYDW